MEEGLQGSKINATTLYNDPEATQYIGNEADETGSTRLLHVSPPHRNKTLHKSKSGFKELSGRKARNFNDMMNGDRFGEPVSDTLPGMQLDKQATYLDLSKPYFPQNSAALKPSFRIPVAKPKFYHSPIDNSPQTDELDSTINHLTDYDILEVDIESLKSMPKESVADQKKQHRTQALNNVNAPKRRLMQMIDAYERNNPPHINLQVLSSSKCNFKLEKYFPMKLF